MTNQKYFQFTMQATTPEELQKRIADNESRGFEVVRYYERDKEWRQRGTSNFVDASGITRRNVVSSGYKIYGVVMRGANKRGNGK